MKKLLITCVMSALAISSSFAQNYPDKPIKILTSFSAGSGPDALLRGVGEKMSKSMSQPLMIDNRPGGNGWIAAD
ncbi:MAG: tripartite tricarboxylate transporter substrate binding protein, partial [Betaproteobacteria bacterium]|nr:tripartite tricarboxylate transporter substrate binding protein [Betaproteobacteria bacterium]